MPNKNYVKGRKYEYDIVHLMRDKGYLAFRSAGSHSPVDVVAIDGKNKIIKLIQCKPKSMSEKAKQRLEEANKDLNGVFNVRFVVV